MRIRKLLLSFCLWLITFLPAGAQVKFSTVVTGREYSRNENVQVDYIIENAASIESLAPPAFKGFTVVSGPMQQSGMSIVNGATSKYEGITYFLRPLSAGQLVIPGATAVVDGKQLRSNSITVTITNGPPKHANPSPSNPFLGLSAPEEAPEVNEEYVLRKGESAAAKIKGNLFVRLDVNKTTCYAGEPIVAVYRLFSRLKSESRVARRPSLSQFSVYDMVQPEASAPAIEKVNGKLYNAHIIRKVQLYPLQDGSFELEPVEIDNTVSFLRLENGNGKLSMQQLMDDYMNGVTDGKLEEQKITLASKPVTITVKPLPAAGKPISFDGAVGRFTIMATVPRMEISANETVELDVLLKGEGNLPLINAPQLTWPAGIEGFEPIVKEDIDKTVSPIKGSKMFQYSFSVKQPGPITIPPVQFSYFDPAANTYRTIQTDSIKLDIKKALKKAGDNNKTGTGKTVEANAPDYKIFLWLLLFVAFAIVVILLRRKKKTTEDTPSVALTAVPEEIPAAPTDKFEAARYALSAVNSQLFYRETGRVVWSLLQEKFGLTGSQLNKPVVLRLLQQANTPAATVLLLENVLNDCELALYTPVHTANDMRQTLEKAERLERELQTPL